MDDEAPIPIDIDSLKKNITEKKEYIINNNNEKFKLLVEKNSFYINFQLYKFDEINFLCYENKFNLKDITNHLKLNPNIYTDLNKIFKLIEELYSKNKIFIKTKNTSIELVLYLYNNSTEYEIAIHLRKRELNIKESFELVTNEIKEMKKNSSNLLDDRLFGIELLLNDIKNEIINKNNNEKKEIEIYEKKIKNNTNELKKNYEDINELKEKIFNIQKYKEMLNINLNEN